ncbi:MAG: hypothetical protein M1839_001953 [Geoglossum umbratile]|nr:MAG: hypothetical protein M1839_001953 [Geoglossum umbratile]
MASSAPRLPAAAAGTGSSSAGGQAGEKSYFEQQRDALVSEIALVTQTRLFPRVLNARIGLIRSPQSLEHVLMNINKLNRNLEGVLAVGKEFDSVEALWSQFEGVMAKDGDAEGGAEGGEDAEGDTTMREGEGGS